MACPLGIDYKDQGKGYPLKVPRESDQLPYSPEAPHENQLVRDNNIQGKERVVNMKEKYGKYRRDRGIHGQQDQN